MIKDRALKADMLRYVARRRWLPQLEVEVLPALSTSRRTAVVTDVDVLALIPDEFNGYRKLLIDCKTGKSESPISRALWLAGLMDHLGATRGLLVMRRPSIPPDHRYFAAERGIVMLTEDDFARYAAATDQDAPDDAGYVGQIELWERFFEIPRRFGRLMRAVRFSKHGYWTAISPGQACRRTIVQTARIARELDPAHREHIALFGELCALFMHALALVTSIIFPAHLQPDTREEMSRALLMVLFGGRESYEQRAGILKYLQKDATGSDVPELSVPNWPGLVQLVRNCLDAPNDATVCPLLLREVAWSLLEGSVHPDMTYARGLASGNRHTTKLSVLAAEYLAKATSAPIEFPQAFTRLLLGLDGPQNQPGTVVQGEIRLAP